jgi:large subunit ribosomal protein L6
MSRIGKNPVKISAGLKVTLSGNTLSIESGKNKTTHEIPSELDISVSDSEITLTRKSESKRSRSLHGLMRTLISNTIQGLDSGFSKKLEIVGRGKRAKVQGKEVVFELGYSHPIHFQVPDGIEISVEKTTVEVKGADKQLVGQVASDIRELQPPEPYKGAGIRYSDEHIKKKAGKSAVGGGFTGAGK